MDPSTYSIQLTVTLLTSREAEVKWVVPAHIEAHSFQLVIFNTRKSKEVTFFIGSDENSFRVPVYLHPSDTYFAQIKALTLVQPEINTHIMYQTLAKSNACHFLAELQKDELKELMERAKHHKNPGRQSPKAPVLCQWMYRNKPPEYFADLMLHHDWRMEVYNKDYNGDPASPINGRLNGLFFGTSIDIDTGLPPLNSHFGTQRININSEILFHSKTNLYFADFYCNNFVHYVTLVITTNNSVADKLCKEKLVQLDVSNNPFFYKKPSVYTGMQRTNVYVAQNVWVEVLFTETIDLKDILTNKKGHLNIAESVGTSRRGGIPKNPDCKICNLYR